MLPIPAVEVVEVAVDLLDHLQYLAVAVAACLVEAEVVGCRPENRVYVKCETPKQE